MNYAPIALFVYNRIGCLQETLNALKENFGAEQSTLFVFSDGPKNDSDFSKVRQVRDYLHKNQNGFREVIFCEKEKNQGLAQSIIGGVSELCRKFGKVIVLEDDIVTAPFFLTFMNQSLAIYEERLKIVSVCGYLPPVFHQREKENHVIFLPGTDCWGWGTWADRWENFEKDGRVLLQQLKMQKKTRIFNYNSSPLFSNVSMLEKQIQGKINSWAIRWHGNAVLKNQVTVFPSYTLVYNAGLGDGTNCRLSQNYFNSELWQAEVSLCSDIQIRHENIQRIKWFYMKTHFFMLILALFNLLLTKGAAIWKTK